MPYIKKESREVLAKIVNAIKDFPPQSPAQLNYLFSVLASEYLKNAKRLVIPPSHYDLVNDVVGALESAKIEFYRRNAVDYEDKKIKENGDVY